MSRGPFDGVLAPVLTPFNDDLSVDIPSWVDFCRQLLDEGCSGLAIFGTTSEANALSLEEKLEMLSALREAGVPGAKLMPGTGLCALPETVRLTRAAVEAGAGAVLLLPPFYYKTVSEEGLYRYAAEVIQRVGDSALRIYLYHIPPIAQVGWPPELVTRLARDFPETVVGLKDSGGDMAYTEAVLRENRDFGAFVGNERFMKEAVELGGPGTITATANVNAKAIAQLYTHIGKSGDVEMNDAVCAVRRTAEQFPTISGLKAVVARRTGHPGWERVRPPLMPLPQAQGDDLKAKLDALGALAPVK